MYKNSLKFTALHVCATAGFVGRDFGDLDAYLSEIAQKREKGNTYQGFRTMWKAAVPNPGNLKGSGT